MAPIAKQDIRFCKAVDGVTIAYSTMGQGLPLVIPPQLVTHLEADLIEGPLAEVYELLSQHFTVIRFDKRGTGLSERDVSDYSSDESFVPDIEAVVDALSLPKFAMYGFSAGGRLGLHYSHEIVYNCFAGIVDSVRSGKLRIDDFFSFLRANPQAEAVFHAGMGNRGRSETAAILEAYNFAETRTVVDVGGGNGGFLSAILAHKAHLSGVLFDQPSAIEAAKDIAQEKPLDLSGDCPAALRLRAICRRVASLCRPAKRA